MKEEILEIYDDSSGEYVKYRAIELISGAAGQYMGQEFAEDYPTQEPAIKTGWHYYKFDWQELLIGPDRDTYNEAWINTLNRALFIDPNDEGLWCLYQDEGGCNLWMIRPLN